MNTETIEENRMKIDKEVAAAELARIENEHGQLTPEAVVEAARAKHSPLHAYFDWNDRAAAHSWRIHQARQLIHSVHVEIRTVNHGVVRVPAYVRDPHAEAKAQGYLNIDVVKNEREMATRVMENELRQLEAILARVTRLTAVLGMEKSVKPLARAVAGLRQKFVELRV